MKAAILYDSSAYLASPLKDRKDLYQVDFTVVLPNDEVITESTGETHLEEFFDDWMQEGTPQPKTAQPGIRDYHDAFERIINAGYDTVFGVYLSSSVSGTFQTAHAVGQEYTDQLNIINFDAVGLSVNMEQLIKQITIMIDAGKSVEEIKETAAWLNEQSRFFIAVEKHDNLIKGGRGKALSELENNAFKTLPVLEYISGDTPVLTETYRTNKKRNKNLAELAAGYQEQYPNHKIQIGIGHTLSEDKALKLKEAIQEVLPEHKIDIRLIGTAFCSHLGRNALSFGLMPKCEVE